MASQEPAKRVPRKLTKRRKDIPRASVDIPERFKDGEDADEDVTAPKSKKARFMNQSVFGMIAAAGSRTDFHARLDERSESEDEGEAARDDGAGMVTKETDGRQNEQGRRHRRKISEHRLLRSLPRLSLRHGREARSPSKLDPMSTSQILSPGSPESEDEEESTAVPDSAAGFMSRMLEARAQVDEEHQGSESEKEQTREGSNSGTSGDSASINLATRLMEIFKFDSPEAVIAEYPCWLLQNVLLQGYMYITQKHLCFYAYLPKRFNQIDKSGYLSKRGRQFKYRRYWFILKGDVCSYYTDPGDVYFPAGNIDLRYAISADHPHAKDKTNDPTAISLTTRQRTYQFKADSHPSAKEWVKHLQKVIFRSHNEGDSVKISLPVDNIIDVEENPVVDFADTIKIRVIDNDETYAIDEYFFSFFNFGQDALDVLRIILGDNAQHDHRHRHHPDSGAATPKEEARPTSPFPERTQFLSANQGIPAVRDSVRTTLAPPEPASRPVSRAHSRDSARRSFEARRSFDQGRRSFEDKRSSSKHRQGLAREAQDVSLSSPRPQGSSDSYDTSLGPGPDLTTAVASLDDTASASQILQGSDLFRSPTIPRTAASDGLVEKPQRQSPHAGRPPSNAHNHLHLPGRNPVCRRPSDDVRRSSYIESEEPSDDQHGNLQESESSFALQDLKRAGAYPIQKASDLAGFLRKRSKHMSNLLATESMGYYEKVSGMWAGGKQHYTHTEGLAPDDEVEGIEEGESATAYGDRFRAHFALPETEKLQATYFASLSRVLPIYGKIYISNRSFCFRSLLPGTRTKLILPLKDIETVEKSTTFRLGWHGLVIVIRGHGQVFFEFGKARDRDDCAVTLLQILDEVKYLEETGTLTQEEQGAADAAKAEHEMLQRARAGGPIEHESKVPRALREADADTPPIIFDDPRASILNFKPTESLRITCLTIGSRGDVQPYIALCKGLLAEGHKPKIATHREFETWIRKHGIDFAPVEGDPAELMRICVDYGMFTYSFLKEATTKFRGWLDELLSSAWKACQNTDILIESPSAMAGIHIAEALAIPYFRAFSMPWTRTRVYPHAFAVHEHKMGGTYNYMTYVMFDNVFWKAIAGQVNRWRKRELRLRSTSLEKMQPNKVPFMYCFSPSVVVPPLDYSDWIRVTGYWFLDEEQDWSPPAALTSFIAAARKSGKKLVYIGFGSVVVEDPAALTKTVVDSVLKADVRCILSKGWSDRLGKKDSAAPELPLPPSILQITYSVPHDWLFKQMDAAVHHGGCGTTGASLRAGIPTVIKPFFGDQFFFGQRVEDLGVGLCVRRMNTSVFARSLWQATSSERIIAKARALGEQIRQEAGVATAIKALYRDMEYAKSLVKRPEREKGEAGDEGAEEGPEESWTLIGEDDDPELGRRIREWEPQMKGHGGGDNVAEAMNRSVVFTRRAAGLVPEQAT